MGADKGKKLKVEEKTEVEEVDHLDGELVLSIEKLQEIQDELEKVNEEASDEVLVVEQKYTLIRRPVYDKRNEIIKSIPDFWLTAFLSHPALGDLLNEDDQKIFKYLKSMDVEDCKDVKSGYSITFNFNENPYFENASLVKSFLFSDEGTTKITGTKINWKEGMDIISNGVDHEKKGNKRSHDEESFFTWFCDDQDKTLLEALHDEVAEVIKDDLWPNPLKYFNNEADEDFDDEEGEEGDEEGKEDDDEDDEDEDAEE